jgi:hypothetical protein
MCLGHILLALGAEVKGLAVHGAEAVFMVFASFKPC